jgi:DNA-binding transcriptional ArsR family regulator
MNMARAATTADVFNAIAEPRRREVIGVLADGREYAVGDMVMRLRMSQPAVSSGVGGQARTAPDVPLERGRTEAGA